MNSDRERGRSTDRFQNHGLPHHEYLQKRRNKKQFLSSAIYLFDQRSKASGNRFITTIEHNKPFHVDSN